jgi:hypothetical protein
MSLKLTYYGQNDSVNATPAVALVGDPGTDQTTLTNAGYLGGVIVAIADSTLVKSGFAYQSANEPAFGAIGNIVPCDADTATNSYGYTANGQVPFGTLLNGPGEFAGAIGPSGSRKAPVVRALWQGNVDFQGYDAAATFILGGYVYCGGNVNSNIGKYTDGAHAGIQVAATNSKNNPASTDAASGSAYRIPVGICTHVPSAAEPWLGVASLI